jgi:hypothetical protein
MPSILKDGSGNILKDPITGSIINIVAIDNGVKLNGTDDEILISAINALLKIPASVPFSIMMVIGANVINIANKAILNSKDSNNGISIAFNGSTDLLFNIGTGASSNRLLKTFTGMGPAVNEIAAIGWTKSNLNTLAALKGYKHGREITTTGGAASTLTSFTYSTTHPMRVGNDPSAAGRYGAFTIWDLKIFREELSSNDVALYAAMDGKYIPDGSRIINLTGTTTVTSGSTAVTGSGTKFLSEAKVGKALFDSSNVYLGNIASITSDTALTLIANAAASASGTVKHGSWILGWDFEEKSGTTVADASGVGQSGTISGSSSTALGGTNMHVNNTWQSITS